MGFDPANFRDAMNGPDVNLLLREDQLAYKSLRARRVPTIFIDGREAPRFQAEGKSIVGDLLDAAVTERQQAEP